MRKYIKNNLCNIIEQLAKVNETLIAKGMSISQGQVQEILTDCQQGAVEVGGKIEECEGEGTEAVRLLEQYCEKVYLLCINWLDEKLREKELKNIRVLLNKVKNSILYDIKDSKKEVVFLPYKASMWDSLESVWKAADEDPECDAYVIPIPYYDKNPDGSFKEMHYEGDLYPKYVPITDWQAYDLEKRHPDVIFIHNPYDGGNHVTSVHPQYYSKVIKNYTDKLVYIPYFVTPDVLPDWMCVNAGTLNADIVITQSEQVRKNHIESFERVLGREHSIELLDTMQNKIISLGSPKVEKAYKTTKAEYPLPDEWIERIGNKINELKIICYNTSISTILQYDEQYIKNLSIVLTEFRECKDIILWWRPHPLSEATLQSMRPQIYEKYMKIVQTYKEEKWGIYDDTPDLYRALAWCDAYYGDRSSVTMLFSAMYKPVMIQSIQTYPIAFENFCDCKEHYWIEPIWNNGLYRINKEDYTAEYVSTFIGERKGVRLHINTMVYEDKLVFVPFGAEAIAIYSTTTNIMEMLPVAVPENCGKLKYCETSKFTFGYQYGKYIYMFPGTYPAIIKLNMENYAIEYLREPIEKLEQCVIDVNNIYMRTGECCDKKVFMWSSATSSVVEFDMESETIKICSHPEIQGKYIEMVKVEDKYCLIPANKESKLVVLSEKYEPLYTIDIPKGEYDFGISYLRGINVNAMLWMFPGTAEYPLAVDLNTKQVKRMVDFEAETMSKELLETGAWKFFFAQKKENCIYAHNQYSGELMIYNYKEQAMIKKQVKVEADSVANDDYFMKVLEEQTRDTLYESFTYVYESELFLRKHFIEMVVGTNQSVYDTLKRIMQEVNERAGVPERIDVGADIYNYVKIKL